MKEETAGIIAKLADRSGVAEADVQRVLDTLGLETSLDLVSRSFGPDAIEALTADGVRLSVRVSDGLVAR
jgi:hypothetical protein